MIRAIIILNERALRFVYQDKIPTYETLVIKNGYSTLANQTVAKMLNTAVFGAIGNENVTYKYFRVIDGT